MATCGACGTTILFGGKSDGENRYCNDECFEHGRVLAMAERIPEEDLQRGVHLIHQGDCPICQGPGPVDMHTSYRVWSALVMTSHASRPRMSCRGCGVKAKLGDLAISGLLGWWGLPWGLIYTPVQIFRNIAGLLNGPDPSRPSGELTATVRFLMADHAASAFRK